MERLEDRSTPAVLAVGPGKAYPTVGAAAAAANAGDTIRIDPVTLTGPAAYAVFSDNDLVIEGAGPGRTVLDATGYFLPNRKGIFTFGSAANNATVRNIEFKGAHDPNGDDRNWAGIRAQNSGLTVQNCYFHHNDDGILGGDGATSDVVIEYTEFGRNGYGDGLSHSLYIGDARSLTLRHCYMHDTLVGHDVKSRAATNHILYNWIGATGFGTESYELSFPDGGTAYVVGNVIRQDGATGNGVVVDWGSENNGGANPSQGVFLVNNTFVNDRTTGTFVRLGGGVYPSSIRLVNNLFAGSGAAASTVYSGPTAELTTNLVAANPGFLNAAAFDYRLTASASAAIGTGTAPGSANGFALAPTQEYVAVAGARPRPVLGVLDRGAFEYVPTPVLLSATINDTGNAPSAAFTHSRVTKLILTFNTAVSAVDAGAFTLTRGTTILQSGGAVVVAGLGTNTLTLTFAGTIGVEGGSLADGVWALTTDLSTVRNTSGVGGTGTTLTANIRRLYGDANGDGVVNLTDFGAFGATFGMGAAAAGFNPAFDFNGDGTITLTDFGAFGQRFGKGI